MMGQTALPIVPQVSDDLLEQYALRMLKIREADSPLQQTLREIEKIAEVESIPIIGALEGRILAELVAGRCGAGCQVLDIGTAIGYSALWLATVLGPGGKIISIELDPVRANRAQEFIRRAGVQDRIDIVVGDVFDILPSIGGKFDVIFQDVMKHVYFAQDPKLALRLLDLCTTCLKDDGVLLTDNAFCQGRVLQESDLNQVKGIQAYNEAIANHRELDSLLMPFRDGLWLSRRRVARAEEK